MSNKLPFAPAGAAAAVGLLCALALALALPIDTAEAASERVKSACKDDYFRHCSSHALGSDSLRQCMRGVGENLSTGCLVALVEDGEITKQDIERHKAKQAEAKTDKAAADAKPAPSAGTATASAKPAPAKINGSGKPGNAPKVASIGKTELPSTAPKPQAAPAKPAQKQEATKAKRQPAAAKVASTGKTSPPPAADKSQSAVKATSVAKAASKSSATSGAKTGAPSVATKVASTGKAAPAKPTTPASKSVARQPGLAALSGEGAQLSAAAGQRFTRNVCHAKTIAGDPISQTCAIDEKCCFSGIAGKLRCVPQTATCNGF